MSGAGAGAGGDAVRTVLGLESGGEHLSAAVLEACHVARSGSGEARPVARSGSGDAGDDDGVGLRVRVRAQASAVRGARAGTSDLAFTLMSEALAQAGTTVAELSLVAVPRGPGSFTGVRVALSLAAGLGLASGVPIWPVSSLAALALNGRAFVAPGRPDGLVLALIDARKGEVYAGLYRVGAGVPSTLLAPMLGTWQSALAAAREVAGEEGFVTLGTGAVAYGLGGDLPAHAHVGHASATAALALAEWRAAGWDTGAAAPLDPAYLRKSEAEIAADLREAAEARAAAKARE